MIDLDRMTPEQKDALLRALEDFLLQAGYMRGHSNHVDCYLAELCEAWEKHTGCEHEEFT